MLPPAAALAESDLRSATMEARTALLGTARFMADFVADGEAAGGQPVAVPEAAVPSRCFLTSDEVLGLFCCTSGAALLLPGRSVEVPAAGWLPGRSSWNTMR